MLEYDLHYIVKGLRHLKGNCPSVIIIWGLEPSERLLKWVVEGCTQLPKGVLGVAHHPIKGVACNPL